MIFHSLDFAAFFIVTLAVYWILPRRPQNVLLLVASYVFYGWVHPWWPVLLFVTTFVDYWAARRIGELSERQDLETSGPRRKAWLWLSIVANLGLLGFYKYFDFFVENVAAALDTFGLAVDGPVLRILLPVGISFYTFQAMSYTIDVYRGELRARRSLLDLAVFAPQ